MSLYGSPPGLEGYPIQKCNNKAKSYGLLSRATNQTIMTLCLLIICGVSLYFLYHSLVDDGIIGGIKSQSGRLKERSSQRDKPGNKPAEGRQGRRIGFGSSRKSTSRESLKGVTVPDTILSDYNKGAERPVTNSTDDDDDESEKDESTDAGNSKLEDRDEDEEYTRSDEDPALKARRRRPQQQQEVSSPMANRGHGAAAQLGSTDQYNQNPRSTSHEQLKVQHMHSSNSNKRQQHQQSPSNGLIVDNRIYGAEPDQPKQTLPLGQLMKVDTPPPRNQQGLWKQLAIQQRKQKSNKPAQDLADENSREEVVGNTPNYRNLDGGEGTEPVSNEEDTKKPLNAENSHVKTIRGEGAPLPSLSTTTTVVPSSMITASSKVTSTSTLKIIIPQANPTPSVGTKVNSAATTIKLLRLSGTSTVPKVYLAPSTPLPQVSTGTTRNPQVQVTITPAMATRNVKGVLQPVTFPPAPIRVLLPAAAGNNGSQQAIGVPTTVKSTMTRTENSAGFLDKQPITDLTIPEAPLKRSSFAERAQAVSPPVGTTSGQVVGNWVGEHRMDSRTERSAPQLLTIEEALESLFGSKKPSTGSTSNEDEALTEGSNHGHMLANQAVITAPTGVTGNTEAATTVSVQSPSTPVNLLQPISETSSPTRFVRKSADLHSSAKTDSVYRHESPEGTYDGCDSKDLGDSNRTSKNDFRFGEIQSIGTSIRRWFESNFLPPPSTSTAGPSVMPGLGESTLLMATNGEDNETLASAGQDSFEVEPSEEELQSHQSLSEPRNKATDHFAMAGLFGKEGPSLPGRKLKKQRRPMINATSHPNSTVMQNATFIQIVAQSNASSVTARLLKDEEVATEGAFGHLQTPNLTELNQHLSSTTAQQSHPEKGTTSLSTTAMITHVHQVNKPSVTVVRTNRSNNDTQNASTIPYASSVPTNVNTQKSIEPRW